MAEIKKNFKSVQKFNSELTPDCAKFCPIKGYESYLIIAYYELRNEKVYGGLELYQVESNQIVLRDKVQSAGVLDFQWFYQQVNDTVYFCTACSDSFVRIYSLKQEAGESHYKLKLEKEIQTEENHKCLYIDVNIDNLQYIPYSQQQSDQLKSEQLHQQIKKVYLFQTSHKKCVYNLLRFIFNKELKGEIQKVQKHQFSIWACGISKENQNLFLSGGDDQKLILCDTRVPDYQVMVNKRTHEMGICTINFDPLNANSFFTGCYDEHLRLWDIRNIQKEVFSSKREGGVWRTIWKPQSSTQALLGVYCQHYFEIVDIVDSCKFNLKIQFNINDGIFKKLENVVHNEKLDGHSSLAYSCDWSQDTKHIITCSFYDKIVQFWSQNE